MYLSLLCFLLPFWSAAVMLSCLSSVKNNLYFIHQENSDHWMKILQLETELVSCQLEHISLDHFSSPEFMNPFTFQVQKLPLFHRNKLWLFVNSCPIVLWHIFQLLVDWHHKWHIHFWDVLLCQGNMLTFLHIQRVYYCIYEKRANLVQIWFIC